MRHRAAATAAAAIAALLAGGAHAQSAGDPMTDALIACLDIGADDERLSCLESAAEALKAMRAKAVDGGGTLIGAQADAGDAAAQDDLFGAEALASTKRAKREKAKTARLDAGVVEIRPGPLKNVTVVLDNGQVWRQLEGDRAEIRPPKNPAGLTATVTKGAFGNYWMTINEIDRQIRVKRIK